MTRVLLDSRPFADPDTFWAERGRWPAQWITHPDADGTEAVVLAFVREFDIPAQRTVRVHVSADERYELYLDGERLGRGPERGDRRNWFFETHDLQLGPGPHVLAARTWWLGEHGPAPMAQVSVRPAFILAVEGDDSARDLLATGFAPWRALRLNGYSSVEPGVTWGTGAKVRIAAAEFPFGFALGQGDGWQPAVEVGYGYDDSQLMDQPPRWLLRPATLPAMVGREVDGAVVRHVEEIDGIDLRERTVLAADHRADESSGWAQLFAGHGGLVIPPNSARRVIVDLGRYHCGYTHVVTSGGRGSVLRSWWAESLFEPGPPPSGQYGLRAKGHRDEIEGKVFVGNGDTFEPDGGDRRAFDTLWWEAGRYLEVSVSTAAEALSIDSFVIEETRYPTTWHGQFESDDERLAGVLGLARRAMEMCSHETYVDCPYYEQMMYVGDTRLEALVTYAWSRDDRLPRKALDMFDRSRKAPGFTQSRYPTSIEQTIAPFSAWWIAMVHDFMMWRGDPEFVRALLPGVRAVLDSFDRYRGDDGLLTDLPGWNFVDWVPAWKDGIPPDAMHGASAPINLAVAWAAALAAEIEDYAGEPELAALHRRRSAELTDATLAVFWDESRGLVADDRAHEHFSEHSQCLLLLGDRLGGRLDAAGRTRVEHGLRTEPDLARATIYFSHYLFEAYRQMGDIDGMFDRLPLWYDQVARGMTTTVEMPEPTRSDSHAWGAHPIYHYLTSIVGVRPGSPGFSSVEIRPQLGPLGAARGLVPHPRGEVAVDLRQADGVVSGSITLPPGVTGALFVNGTAIEFEGRIAF